MKTGMRSYLLVDCSTLLLVHSGTLLFLNCVALLFLDCVVLGLANLRTKKMRRMNFDDRHTDEEDFLLAHSQYCTPAR